jgi:hypothetical protein
LPLGEGLQLHYVERTVLPPKWLHWRTFLRPFEWFNGQSGVTAEDKSARTSP